MKTLANLIVIAAVVAGFVFMASHAINAQEVVTCNKLVSQSEEGYQGFYITQLENDMCNAHGISVNAPIK